MSLNTDRWKHALTRNDAHLHGNQSRLSLVSVAGTAPPRRKPVRRIKKQPNLISQITRKKEENGKFNKRPRRGHAAATRHTAAACCCLSACREPKLWMLGIKQLLTSELGVVVDDVAPAVGRLVLHDGPVSVSELAKTPRTRVPSPPPRVLALRSSRLVAALSEPGPSCSTSAWPFRGLIMFPEPSLCALKTRPRFRLLKCSLLVCACSATLALQWVVGGSTPPPVAPLPTSSGGSRKPHELGLPTVGNW